MPTVPYISQPRVGLNPLPNARVNPSAPIEAFGGGIAAQQPDLSGPANVAGEVSQQNALERQRIRSEAALEADQIAVTKATSVTQNGVNDFMHGPDGLLNRQGNQAFTIDQEAYDKYGELVSNVRSNLTNDRQRAVYDKYVQNGWDAIQSQTVPHIAAQRKVFDKESTDAAILAAKNAAIAAPLNPVVVEQSVTTAMAVRASQAQRLGLPDEEKKNIVADAASDIHLAVIQSILSSPTNPSRDLMASAYFDKHKDELVGKDLVDAERLTKAQSLEGESVRLADQIILQAKDDENKQLELAAKIENPMIRVKTEERLSFLATKHAAANRVVEQKAAFDGYTMLEHNNWDTTSVPQSMREKMGLAHWENLVTAARTATNQAAKGGPGDREKTSQLINESRIDPDTFLARNIDTEEGLNYAQRDRLVAMQKSLDRSDLAPLRYDLSHARQNEQYYTRQAQRLSGAGDTAGSAAASKQAGDFHLQAVAAERALSEAQNKAYRPVGSPAPTMDQLTGGSAPQGTGRPPATAPLTVPTATRPLSNPIGLTAEPLKPPTDAMAIGIAQAKAAGARGQGYLDLLRLHGIDVDAVPAAQPVPPPPGPVVQEVTVHRDPKTDKVTKVTKKTSTPQ